MCMYIFFYIYIYVYFIDLHGYSPITPLYTWSHCGTICTTGMPMFWLTMWCMYQYSQRNIQPQIWCRELLPHVPRLGCVRNPRQHG